MGGGGDRVSVVIPCLDEGAVIERLLRSLQPMRDLGHELILVDGGSRDGSVERAGPWVDHLLKSPPGRARQMNAGARAAQGDIFWFLHADSTLCCDPLESILDALIGEERCWGRFDVRLSGGSPLLRLVSFMMNWRSRLSGIATGDQGIFVRRHAFFSAGGFPDIQLMEDVAISRNLKRLARPCCLRQRLGASGRRWERDGVVRTVLHMWRLRLAYALGADPSALARRYRQCSSPAQDS
ncbi:MAG: TIGR04283 family arsenosugar biosynthesis glycosyltransferase [Candidatus Sedimenticola endophacoides]